MGRVYITDYVEDSKVEAAILGEELSKEPHEDIEVLLVWHQQVNEEYLRQFPKLRGIVRYGSGIDNIDLDCAKSRKIIICNTPDYGIDEVADSALAMILQGARGVTRYDALCRHYPDGTWQEHTLKYLKRVEESTLGLYGCGRLGSSVALKAKAVGFHVLFFDPYQEPGHEKVLGINRCDTANELLERADIVSLHTPLTPQTRGLVDTAFIKAMKPSSGLVNTSRGQLTTDLDVLYESLHSEHLRFVGLDVLPQEPPEPHRLLDAWRNRESWIDGRLIINPHVSYYSQQSFLEMRTKATESAFRILLGKTVRSCIK